jgi:hypothetical protein
MTPRHTWPPPACTPTAPASSTPPPAFDRAGTARDLHWATTSAFLTEDELGELTSATAASSR